MTITSVLRHGHPDRDGRGPGDSFLQNDAELTARRRTALVPGFREFLT